MCVLQIETMDPLRVNKHKNRHFDSKLYIHASAYGHKKDLLNCLTLIATF